MPKLNEIKGLAEKPKKKAAKQVLAKEITGKLVGQIAKYNAAADRAKLAQGEMAEIAPVLLAEGLEFVFDHNCACREDTKQQIKSVNLTEPRTEDMAAGDEAPEAVQFSWSTRTGKCDAALVKAHFAALVTLEGKSADVNKYAEDVIVVDFDKKALLDSKGKFMQARFDKFKKALDEVAAELSIENPLTFYKEFKATGEMNDLRFKELDTQQNLALHLVMPTSCSLEPVRSNGED